METAPDERLEPIVSFWVSGQPKGQPRGRAFAVGGKARIFTAGTAESWKGQIALAAAGGSEWQAEPIAYPCFIAADVFFPRPKRLMRRKDSDGPVPHEGTPDWDNAGKAICDALEDIGVVLNDKWFSGRVTKWYHSKTGAPGARITVSRRLRSARLATEEDLRDYRLRLDEFDVAERIAACGSGHCGIEPLELPEILGLEDPSDQIGILCQVIAILYENLPDLRIREQV